MGDVNVHGDKAKGEKDANQRSGASWMFWGNRNSHRRITQSSDQFGEGTESKKGGGAAGEDIMEVRFMSTRMASGIHKLFYTS